MIQPQISLCKQVNCVFLCVVLGVLNRKAGNWDINTRIFFGPLQSYEIVSLISKDERAAEARITLTLTSGTPPSVYIE